VVAHSCADARCANLAEDASEHVFEVLSVYGKYSPWDLERMTHSEGPWKEARGTLPPDVPSGAIISHESMREFYRQQ